MLKALRTVWNLAARVEAMEKTVQNVQSEWADTLDLLTKREARERMRALRSVRASLEPDQAPANGSIAPQGKQALRAAARARGLLPPAGGSLQ